LDPAEIGARAGFGASSAWQIRQTAQEISRIPSVKRKAPAGNPKSDKCKSYPIFSIEMKPPIIAKKAPTMAFPIHSS
jgi:hypothetical protein